mmetsp:Transcript_17187/g.69597  ORF Transcript_17187/g.69597 Transcript_17187/m.69597 type:complete len:204 (+) Transcript_17187:149-760(+)
MEPVSGTDAGSAFPRISAWFFRSLLASSNGFSGLSKSPSATSLESSSNTRSGVWKELFIFLASLCTKEIVLLSGFSPDCRKFSKITRRAFGLLPRTQAQISGVKVSPFGGNDRCIISWRTSRASVILPFLAWYCITVLYKTRFGFSLPLLILPRSPNALLRLFRLNIESISKQNIHMFGSRRLDSISCRSWSASSIRSAFSSP